MSDKRVQVRLVADARNFSGRLAVAVEAAHSLNVRLATQAATWEPHDWADFRKSEDDHL